MESFVMVVVIRRPLVVDETADNDEPTEADIEAARENWRTMSPVLREYLTRLDMRLGLPVPDRNGLLPHERGHVFDA